MIKYDYAADRARRFKQTRSNGGIAPVDTHNAATYVNWGCRCDECRRANTSAQRQRRARAGGAR